jgi:hypothetical protein
MSGGTPDEYLARAREEVDYKLKRNKKIADSVLGLIFCVIVGTWLLSPYCPPCNCVPRAPTPTPAPQVPPKSCEEYAREIYRVVEQIQNITTGDLVINSLTIALVIVACFVWVMWRHMCSDRYRFEPTMRRFQRD